MISLIFVCATKRMLNLPSTNAVIPFKLWASFRYTGLTYLRSSPDQSAETPLSIPINVQIPAVNPTIEWGDEKWSFDRWLRLTNSIIIPIMAAVEPVACNTQWNVRCDGRVNSFDHKFCE